MYKRNLIAEQYRYMKDGNSGIKGFDILLMSFFTTYSKAGIKINQ